MHQGILLNAITIGIAMVGAVLGILNTWLNFERNRVKIRVTPKNGYIITRDETIHYLTIEIINLSAFPVTVSQVGLLLHGTNRIIDIIDPTIYGGGSLPHRLESHSSFNANAPPNLLSNENFYRVRCAFAKTDCGYKKKGKSQALKGLVKKAKAMRNI